VRRVLGEQVRRHLPADEPVGARQTGADQAQHHHVLPGLRLRVQQTRVEELLKQDVTTWHRLRPRTRRTRPVSASAAVWERITITTQQRRWPTAYESVPKIIINNTINSFLKLQSSFWQFQAITVSESCLIKLFRYILSEKNRFIFQHWE